MNNFSVFYIKVTIPLELLTQRHKNTVETMTSQLTRKMFCIWFFKINGILMSTPIFMQKNLSVKILSISFVLSHKVMFHKWEKSVGQ